MRFCLLLLLCFTAVSSFSQSIQIRSITFSNSNDPKLKSSVPFAVATSGKRDTVAEKINRVIKEELNLESFDPANTKEFRWSDLDFKASSRNNILQIAFSGEYYGAYPSYVKRNLYFNLLDGTELQEEILPFNSLFSLEGYYLFLKKYWNPGASKALSEAYKCAEITEECHFNDILLSFDPANVIFKLQSDCFPHAVQSCAPEFSVAVPYSTLKPYLNSFGDYVLFKTNYRKMDALDRFIFFKNNKSKVPDYCYFSGSIDGKYPFSMALYLNGRQVKGYYYYEKQQKLINLDGKMLNNEIALKEKVDNLLTGIFTFKRSTEYAAKGFYTGDEYWTGTWKGRDNLEHTIALKDVKFNVRKVR